MFRRSGVPWCSVVFRGVPWCSVVFRGVPVFRGVSVFRCSGVPGFSTSIILMEGEWAHFIGSLTTVLFKRVAERFPKV